MKKTTKIVEIEEIVIDEDLYPRLSYDWETSKNYQEHMEAGDKFPPIQLALYKRSYVLIDGKHRIEATRNRGEEFIQAVIYKGLSAKQIFTMAIEANLKHGKALTYDDKTKVVCMLEDLKFSLKQISKIVKIPTDKITTLLNASKLTNELSKVNNSTSSRKNNFNSKLNEIEFDDSESHIDLVIQLHTLISDGELNYKDKKLMIELNKLKGLLNSLKFRGKRK